MNLFRDRLILEKGGTLTAPSLFLFNESDIGENVMGRFKKGYTPWNKGLKGVQKHTDETKKAISDSLIGNTNTLGLAVHTDQPKEKISEAVKNRTPWNKGLSGEYEHSDETKKKMSETRINDLSGKYLKSRTDGYCDIWSDTEYRKDLRKDFCEACGMSNEESFLKWGEKLSLHHKNGDLNCAPKDIATLCKSCHLKERKDCKHTDETKSKISKALRNRTLSNEHRKRISDSLIGNKNASKF